MKQEEPTREMDKKVKDWDSNNSENDIEKKMGNTEGYSVSDCE